MVRIIVSILLGASIAFGLFVVISSSVCFGFAFFVVGGPGRAMLTIWNVLVLRDPRHTRTTQLDKAKTILSQHNFGPPMALRIGLLGSSALQK